MSQGFINSSEDVKNLKTEELVALCEQIREEIISVTQKNGGHRGGRTNYGASLRF